MVTLCMHMLLPMWQEVVYLLIAAMDDLNSLWLALQFASLISPTVSGKITLIQFKITTILVMGCGLQDNSKPLCTLIKHMVLQPTNCVAVVVATWCYICSYILYSAVLCIETALFKTDTFIAFFQTELSQECKQKWDTFALGTLADVNKKNTVEFVSILFVLHLFKCRLLCILPLRMRKHMKFVYSGKHIHA